MYYIVRASDINDLVFNKDSQLFLHCTSSPSSLISHAVSRPPRLLLTMVACTSFADPQVTWSRAVERVSAADLVRSRGSDTVTRAF